MDRANIEARIGGWKKYTLDSSSQSAHTISEYEREREWGRIKIYKCITEINVEKNNNN